MIRRAFLIPFQQCRGHVLVSSDKTSSHFGVSLWPMTREIDASPAALCVSAGDFAGLNHCRID